MHQTLEQQDKQMLEFIERLKNGQEGERPTSEEIVNYSDPDAQHPHNQHPDYEYYPSALQQYQQAAQSYPKPSFQQPQTSYSHPGKPSGQKVESFGFEGMFEPSTVVTFKQQIDDVQRGRPEKIM